MPERLLTRVDAADMLGIKPATLSAWACLKSHDLPYVKIGSRAMYRFEDIEAFITRNTVFSQSR